MSEKKDANTLWEDVRDWLADATRTAIQEAEDLSRRGRLKVQLMNLNRKIEKELAELGGVAYHHLNAATDQPFAQDERVGSIVERIRKLESERKLRQQEYEAEKQDRQRD